MQPDHTPIHAELLRTALRHRQSERLGEIVDESTRRAAEYRKEQAERDRAEREAEERRQRLDFFRELEHEDAQRLAERKRLEEQARIEQENRRKREQVAQLEADIQRAKAWHRHEWEA
ncbi:MAG: hypothetical protein Kow0022_11900 [Phycisphaerales bacterium]